MFLPLFTTLFIEQESKIETYKRMWQFMSANSEVFVANNDVGVQKVKNGGYALLMESATLDYKYAHSVLPGVYSCSVSTCSFAGLV